MRAAPAAPAALRPTVIEEILRFVPEARDGLESLFRRRTDEQLARLVLTVAPAEVAQARAALCLPAARCGECRDRPVAAGRTHYCHECAFDLYERRAGRYALAQADRSMARHRGEMLPSFPPPRVGPPVPTRETCIECGGCLGPTRREFCGPCAFGAFLRMTARLVADGQETP